MRIVNRTNIISSIKRFQYISKRLISSNGLEESRRQSDLFISEQNKQKKAVGRIEKIEIKYEGQPADSILSVNKNLSTPYDCSRHLPDKIRYRTVVALLDHKTIWHMHKPLIDNCVMELLHFHIPNPTVVNKIFWRTCSFLLGAVASDAFKTNIEFHLHSFPSPNVKSGSFVYDIQLGLDNWKPTESELKVLSLEFVKFCQKDYRIECLDVDKSLAFEIFKNNPHKTEQIPDIAENNGDKVTLYKVGQHIDISRGPMLPNTNQLGRVTVTNVIQLNTDIKGNPIYRFQGVALPKAIHLNHFGYGLIEEHGRILNFGRVPGTNGTINEDNSFIANLNQ